MEAVRYGANKQYEKFSCKATQENGKLSQVVSSTESYDFC